MLELFIEVCKLFQDKVMLNKKKEKKKKKRTVHWCIKSLKTRLI